MKIEKETIKRIIWFLRYGYRHVNGTDEEMDEWWEIISDLEYLIEHEENNND